jgi:hypothetical protein
VDVHQGSHQAAFISFIGWNQSHSLTSQEFNLEKLQLVEQEKAKIRKDYERREGQVDVKKKMLVATHPSVDASTWLIHSLLLLQ